MERGKAMWTVVTIGALGWTNSSGAAFTGKAVVSGYEVFSRHLRLVSAVGEHAHLS